MMSRVKFECAPKFEALLDPARYKVFYGGRGAGKSYAFAQILLALASQRKLRILCARELQNSITDSVYRLLVDIINKHELHKSFDITKTEIRNSVGSEFIFKGLRHNVQEIKSLEGVDICWVEEAQSVSKESWDLLIPTIRKEKSEIWISFNPFKPEDETYNRFVLNPPENCLVVKVGWQDNPWFPETLRQEKDYCKRVNHEAYEHIWEGNPRIISEAQIFKDKFVVEEFETSGNVIFYHGVDWGFAKDPTVMIRCFILENTLYVDQEVYGVGVELDNTAQLFDKIPTSRTHPIFADCSRPETIVHMRNRGFNISAALKWSGSVEGGITYLKNFEKIIIHPRCLNTAKEFRLYSYELDRNTGTIKPKIVDAFNHCIDAIRYALFQHIKGKAPMKFNVK